MKKLSFIVLLMSMTFGVSFAQDDVRASARERTPEARAEMMTQRMEKSLSLSTEQTAKIQEINLEHAKKNTALREKYADNREGFRSEMLASHKEREAAYKNVLTNEQFAQYEKAREERMKQWKSHKGAKPGSGRSRSAK
jgi:periplasmic protein CpxP/Spy